MLNKKAWQFLKALYGGGPEIRLDSNLSNTLTIAPEMETDRKERENQE